MPAISHEDIGKAAFDVLEFREHQVEIIKKAEWYMQEAAKPLVSDEDRVEVIMMVVGNDRDEANRAINGLFKTSYPFKLTVYENSLNTRNTSKIWNKLIAESTCPYILIMDSDCYPQNDIITPMMAALKRHDRAIAVGPVGGDSVFPHVQNMDLNENRNEIEIYGHISGCCFLFEKKRFMEIGIFDEGFLFYGQDSDFFERAIEQGWYTYVCPKAYTIHGGSVSAGKSRFNMQEDSWFARCLYKVKKDLRLKNR